MEDINIDIKNNAQTILPVPYPRPPTPSVESPFNYGSAPYPMPLKTSTRVNDDLQYCNFLEPSPRNQMLNVPYEGQKDCPKFRTQPYGKDSCYLMDNKAQGVVGIVCNQPGGSDNANFVRGNQFGVNYPIDFDEYDNMKKLEYTVEQPVQVPLEMENPLLIYDKNTFYPEPSFFLRKNKDFLTYPLKQNYTEWGLPTYVYPYKTMNPIFDDPNQTGIFESFSNLEEPRKKNIFLILMFLLLIIFIVFFNKM
jgi:hypothetical protein